MAYFYEYAALILWIDTMLVIPFAELRLKRKALQFAVGDVRGGMLLAHKASAEAAIAVDVLAGLKRAV